MMSSSNCSTTTVSDSEYSTTDSEVWKPSENTGRLKFSTIAKARLAAVKAGTKNATSTTSVEFLELIRVNKEIVSNSNKDKKRNNRSGRRVRRPRNKNKVGQLRFSSIAEVQSKAVENENLFEGTNAKLIRKQIKWRLQSASDYKKKRNIEMEYFISGRCRILIRRLRSMELVEECDETESLQRWEDEIEHRLEYLEPILTEMYEEVPSGNEENSLGSSSTAKKAKKRQEDWEMIARKGRQKNNNQHFKFKLIGNFEEHTFEEWRECVKLRFQTRQWISSLDSNSDKIIYDKDSREKIGIQGELCFPISKATFQKRMGRAGMGLIKEFELSVPRKKEPLECSNKFPNKLSFFVLIRDEEEYEEHDVWVEELKRCLDKNISKYQIIMNIKDTKQKPIGIYFRIPAPKSFAKFFREMEDFMGAISYVTKTTKKLTGKKLTKCSDMGFFDRMEDSEFY